MRKGRAEPKIIGEDFQQFVHGGSGEPEELCYLYHLDPPLEHAAHYLGTTTLGIEERAKVYGTPFGPRILEVQRERGGGWHLVRTWAGGRLKERALKMQSGARYCPDCTERPRAGDEAPDPRRHIYLTRKERGALKAEKEFNERERELRRHNGPGVEAREYVPVPEQQWPEKTEEQIDQEEQQLTEMEALWIKQAKERDVQRDANLARREGAEAGEREVTEGIARGLSPDTAMERHEEIAGWLERGAETAQDRAFADAYFTSGRYAGESLSEELRDPQAYAELEPKEPADLEMGA